MNASNCRQLEQLESRCYLTALRFSDDGAAAIFVKGSDNTGFVDFDDDGMLDIARSSVVLPGGGDLTFEDPVLTINQYFKGNGHVFPNAIVGGYPIQIGDIDGDGDDDLVSLYYENTAGGRVSVKLHENIDSEGDYRVREIDTNVEFLLSHFISLVDLDGDTDLDVATNVGWYENEHDGQSFKSHRFPDATVHFDLHAVADIDGDGDFDLIMKTAFEQLSWRENNGTGQFAPQQTIDPEVHTYPRAVRAVDMDTDGDIDLIALDVISHTLGWYENYDGNGAFGPKQLIDFQRSLRGSSFVDVADADNDGDMDILTGGTSRVLLLEGLGAWGAGDSNRDGVFDSSDLVHVFQVNEYEDAIDGNSTFDDGDWNGDGDFDSSDFVYAFQQAIYATKATINTARDQLFAAAKAVDDDEYHPVRDGVEQL